MPSVATKGCCLLVDDNKSQVDFMAERFEQSGFAVLKAFDTLTVMETAVTAKPDVIILDVVFPTSQGPDGYELCRQLHDDPRTASIRVVLVTKKGGADPALLHAGADAFQQRVHDRDHGFECGAADFVSKPVDMANLIRRVEELLWYRNNFAAVQDPQPSSERPPERCVG